MRRLTAKVRAVRRRRQVRHYLFNSVVHHEDELAAWQQRGKVWAQVGEVRMSRTPFPEAEHVASAGVRVASSLGRGDQAIFKMADEEEFERVLNEAMKPSAGVYYVPHSSKKKKDGSPVMQRRETASLEDAYFSIPPWYALFFGEVAKLSKKVGEVKEAIFRAVWTAAIALEKRTGYEVLGLAVHPDGETSVGFHVQFRKVRNGKLLGRSADGKRGRKGLRLAGDVNMALHRFDQVIPIPGSWKEIVKSRDYDDVAMDQALTAALDLEVENLAGTEGLEFVKSLAKEYVQDWMAQGHIVEKIKVAEKEAQERQANKTKRGEKGENQDPKGPS